jgi:hypothetical protein
VDQAFHHRIVKFGPDLTDANVLAIRPSAVRQQGYRNLVLRVDPQRGTRESEVTERSRRKAFPG